MTNPRAALIVQHAGAEADLAIVAAINEMVKVATTADANPVAPMKTSPDDDVLDTGGVQPSSSAMLPRACRRLS